MKRVLLIYNAGKAQVAAALQEFRPWLAERAKIIGEMTHQSELPALSERPDLAIVLGGDGTLLATARRIVDLGAPILGVNFGKVGFLAEFNLEQLREHWEAIAAGRCPTTSRLLLKAQVTDPGKAAAAFESMAMNDFVITAGHPFRMIELELTLNPDQTRTTATVFNGDGLIAATPTGSTAYNLACGGPILAPDVDAYVLTAICPYSLAFRPIIISAQDCVSVHVRTANPGTTLVIDGQIARPIAAGSRVSLTVDPRRVQLVSNPAMGYWKTLAKKLRWGVTPRGG